MNQLTGIELFTQDINWIVNQFKDPPFIPQQYKEDRTKSGVVVRSENLYLYREYEVCVNFDHKTFISVQNMWTMKYLTFTSHDPLMKLDEALKIAKQLIRNNKAILTKRSPLESQPIYGRSLAQRLYPIWLANKKQTEIK